MEYTCINNYFLFSLICINNPKKEKENEKKNSKQSAKQASRASEKRKKKVFNCVINLHFNRKKYKWQRLKKNSLKASL